jgi:SAM-dependent methyltransferase
MRRFCSTARRTGAEYAALLQRELAEVHEESVHSFFSPVWESVVDLVASQRREPPSAILDLASGPAAEPAVSLARAFPRASVVASDAFGPLVHAARDRVAALHLGHRLDVERIDLNEVAAFAHADPSELPPIDVVTCSLGLFMVGEDGLAPTFRGLAALLRPGGSLAAAVWDDVPYLTVGANVLADIGVRAEAEASPTRLGHGAADVLLRSAGLELAERHNELRSLPLTLGRAGAERTWMVGMLPYAGALMGAYEGGDEGVFERSREAFDARVAPAVDTDSGLVTLRGQVYRLLSAHKPDS